MCMSTQTLTNLIWLWVRSPDCWWFSFSPQGKWLVMLPWIRLSAQSGTGHRKLRRRGAREDERQILASQWLAQTVRRNTSICCFQMTVDFLIYYPRPCYTLINGFSDTKTGQILNKEKLKLCLFFCCCYFLNYWLLTKRANRHKKDAHAARVHQNHAHACLCWCRHKALGVNIPRWPQLIMFKKTDVTASHETMTPPYATCLE